MKQYFFLIPTLIHIAELFIANVALDENLCMDLNEYQSVMAAAIYLFYYIFEIGHIVAS